MHGVSFSAAREAIAHLEKQGMVSTHHGSGTYVRQATELAGSVKLSNTAHLVFDARPHVFGELTDQLIERLEGLGVLTMRSSYDALRNPQNAAEMVNQWRSAPPRAIVVQALVDDIDRLVKVSCPDETRLIAVMRQPHLCPPGWHTVNPDYRAAFGMATRYLVDRGHKRVGLVAKARLLVPGWKHAQRKAWMWHTEQILAVGHTLRERGIEDGLRICYNAPVTVPGAGREVDPSGIPTDEANVRRMTEWLGQADRPTAVVGDDFRMIGVKIAARAAGLRVPDDLEIVGVGGTLVGQAGEFPIINLRYDLMADELAKLIDAPAEQIGKATRHILVPPTFSPSLNGQQDPKFRDKAFANNQGGRHFSEDAS